MATLWVIYTGAVQQNHSALARRAVMLELQHIVSPTPATGKSNLAECIGHALHFQIRRRVV